MIRGTILVLRIVALHCLQFLLMARPSKLLFEHVKNYSKWLLLQAKTLSQTKFAEPRDLYFMDLSSITVHTLSCCKNLSVKRSENSWQCHGSNPGQLDRVTSSVLCSQLKYTHGWQDMKIRCLVPECFYCSC